MSLNSCYLGRCKNQGGCRGSTRGGEEDSRGSPEHHARVGSAATRPANAGVPTVMSSSHGIGEETTTEREASRSSIESMMIL